MAIASFILSLLALAIGWVPFLGWPLIALGLVFGILAIRRGTPQKGLAIAGVVISSVALLIAGTVGMGVLLFAGNTDTLGDGTLFNDTTETGGTLLQWREKIANTAGPDSEPARTLGQCAELLDTEKVACSAHQGWRVINVFEITDFNDGQNYQFQDFRQGGCPEFSPEGLAYPKTAETGTIITQQESDTSYQVACNAVCNWWDCAEVIVGPSTPPLSKPTAQTWTGTITAQMEEPETACNGGVVAVDYTITLHAPVSLPAALQGEQEITLWSDPSYEDTSGTIQGTANILSQPPREGVIYCELEGGSEERELAFFATGDEQTIQLTEVPGDTPTLRTHQFGKEYFYHEEAGLTDESFLVGFPPLLTATSISENQISGVLKEGYGYTGTFLLQKE